MVADVAEAAMPNGFQKGGFFTRSLVLGIVWFSLVFL